MTSTANHKVRQHRQVAREVLRREILRVAEVTFAEKGYEGARMSDIAKACGIATGTLYNYFRDKQEIFAAIFTGCAAGLRAALREQCSRGQCPVLAIVETVLSYVGQHRSAYILFRDVALFDTEDESCEVFRDFETELDQIIATALETGQRLGHVRADISSVELAVVLSAAVRRAVEDLIRSPSGSAGLSARSVARLFLEGAQPN